MQMLGPSTCGLMNQNLQVRPKQLRLLMLPEGDDGEQHTVREGTLREPANQQNQCTFDFNMKMN